MSFSPISFIASNYRDYKNNWLKAYEPGTTTPKVMALDSDGVVTVAKLEVNKDGFFKSAGGALVIPYIVGNYDLWLFPTEADADANDTSNAERLADNIAGTVLADINAVARVYNVENNQVIDSSDALTILDDILYIYDSVTETAWGKPSEVGLSETIVSVTGEVLTTNVTTYDLVVAYNANSTSFLATQMGAEGDLRFDDGALNPTPTDDTLALQQAVADVRISRTGQMLDGASKGYSVNSHVNFSQGESGIQNFYLKSQVGFASIYDDAMIRAGVGVNIKIRNITFDCQGLSNGILNDTGGFYTDYANLEIDRFKEFGMHVYGSGDQHLSHALITQTGQVADRTSGGIGLDIKAADFKLENSTLRYAETPLKVSGNTLLATGNHFYNGDALSATPATNSTNILLDGQSGTSFCHTYLDKGRVRYKGKGAVAFFDTKLLFNNTPQHESVFNLESTVVDSDWPTDFVFDGCLSTIPLNNGDMKFVTMDESGGTTWSDSAKSIAGEINNRYNGHPRIASHETCTVVAPNRTVISDSATMNIKHSLSAQAFSTNSNTGVIDRYSASYKANRAQDMIKEVVATGVFSSAESNTQGSRTSSELRYATQMMWNRRGDTDFFQTAASGVGFGAVYRDSTNDNLFIFMSGVGQNGINEAFQFNRDWFSPFDDGVKDCGQPSKRWDTIYATNSIISTSDRDLKTDFESLSIEFIPALLSIADAVQSWVWITAKAEKGNKARKHIGPIAQEVYAAFEAIGVDAFDYGFIGKDEREDGSFIWNLRPTELQWAILWAQTQKQKELESKIDLLMSN